MKKIKKARLMKRTGRKQNFKRFVESGYTDIQAFLAACEKDENLLIYTCLTPEELQTYIDKMKTYKTVDEQIDYLVDNQPSMNATEERFERCKESMAAYLKGYIEYNGYKLANAEGAAEDWSAEFWAKYCKVFNFYQERWFHPEKFINQETGQSKTRVSYNPMLYKEFIYIVRMSISSERKHLAFLATQDSNSSIFRLSLESKLEADSDNDKTVGDVLQDQVNNNDTILEKANLTCILEKALKLCKEYPEAAERYDLIKDFYMTQSLDSYDKKTIILGKIFLYKAGLTSQKILMFIKSLSATYKARYNISQARVNVQLQKFKKANPVKKVKALPKQQMGWRELILHKRGEL